MDPGFAVTGALTDSLFLWRSSSVPTEIVYGHAEDHPSVRPTVRL